jgi:hypothetical protein
MNNRLILKPNKEEKPTYYEIYFNESAYVGEFQMLEDGFFYYGAPQNGRFLSEYDLEMILKLLTELNQPWREFIDADFKRMEEMGYDKNRLCLPNENDPDDLPF